MGPKNLLDSAFVVDSKGLYACIGWREFVWQKHCFGSRRLNPSPKVTLRQVHSATVLRADGLADREADGDGLVSAEIGVSIGVRSADCVPILLLDPRSRAVGAIHAGWRGSAAQIIRVAIQSLGEAYGAAPADIQAAIGPCIRACCYEVSAEVAGQFASWPHSLQPGQAGKFQLDLAAANKAQLREAGLSPAHIFDCRLCTFCQTGELFSYRREPANPGRMVSAIERIS